MPRKAMESLTESMFYVLMAFQEGKMCGTDIADYIDTLLTCAQAAQSDPGPWAAFIRD